MRAFFLSFGLVAAACSSAVQARPQAMLTRLDTTTAQITYAESGGAEIWLSADTQLDAADTRVKAGFSDGKATISLPADTRTYVILKPRAGAPVVLGERVLPLQQASNFRDVGGYSSKDGRTVKWGKVYRSGAMPLLTEADYQYVDSLGLDSVIDFRSLEEREVTPNMVDDRTGALFLANDYAIAPLMKDYSSGDRENMYAKMEQLLRPQYRAVFRRIIADEGAVLYHCSAGQDRTGVATALLYDVLDVDRETIVEDYHMSTRLRQTQWEMPEINPADYPGNFIVQYYIASRKAGRGPEPLYTPSGESHIVQFLDYVDAQYGGAEGYLKEALGFSDADIAQLEATMLE
ncbi:MAG: tyrosine-protein phosphatase [Pseudomonadota bacterium]